ncbi:protein doublesex-like, partial [Trichoplusia ni]|uniref:Protein doublesex-like n=1 Tax=Trichoplusia ni TaxID=7111 RepID=A0A7E5X2S4_TRINI
SSLLSTAVSLDALVENCHKLLEKFHYSWEMMPLVLVILNYAGSDLEEASRKIDEGKLMIDEYARKHNLNVFDGLELRNSTRQKMLETHNLSGVISSSMDLF